MPDKRFTIRRAFLELFRRVNANAFLEKRRIGFYETLENRTLLDAASWRNPLLNLDVNDDGQVAPIDALLVINELNRRESPIFNPNQNVGDRHYLNTDGDAIIAPIDALLVINRLNLDPSPHWASASLEFDSGTSGADLITNSLGFVGTSSLKSATTVVRARIGRGPVVELNTDGQGNFEVPGELFQNVPDGQNVAKFLVRSAEGFAQTRLQFTFDTTGPLLSSPRIDSVDDSGKSQSDGVTNVTTPFVKMNVGETADIVLHLGTSPIFAGVSTGGVSVRTPILADGLYTLHASATDVAGNRTTIESRIRIDTQAPQIASVGLSLSSDSGTLGDDQTGYSRVTIEGDTEELASVSIVGSGLSAIASGVGSFRFPNIPLQPGPNSLQFIVSDAAGNSSTVTRVFQKTTSTTENPVLQWNQVALDAIRADASQPTLATRNLAMLSVATHDVLAAIENNPTLMVRLNAPTSISVEAAVSSASHAILSIAYPAQTSSFDATLAQQLGQIVDGTAKSNGISFGLAVAEAIIAFVRTTASMDISNTLARQLLGIGDQPVQCLMWPKLRTGKTWLHSH